MASIRRTLSPYRDRPPHQNGGSPFTAPSTPSSKLFSNGRHPSPVSAFAVAVTRFLDDVFPLRYSRKGSRIWRRPFYRCLLFFLLGFLLGMTPFGHVNDVPSSHDFSFDIEPPPVIVTRPENFFLDTVDLGVVKENFDFTPKKQLLVVTPTYNRALQAYYLNRLGQVLRLVPPPLVWIVVETDAESVETADVLMKSGVMYRHLVCTENSTNVKDRGVHQRNTALEHIEHHKLDGIVYFADDDNIYSLELFESLREIRRFGTWPVAMLAQGKNKAILEGPVCNGSEVFGWHTNDKSKRLRRFHVDMSGFAFNSTILWDPKRWHRPFATPIRQLDSVKEGFQETTFIEQLVEDETQMEGTPPNCSRIMNWHLHLESRGLVYPKGWLLQKNLDAILQIK
ncbi:hypothetical protein RHMOL_Rhmol06G0085400 [Rhododendron molle]|uniref:Uncharacterized protein n=1 Tax=Rhododendron molle TaxID=49168 RepID=A0ACC0NA39_RHOML|nr:hypothetical protein RHMOL_Rhmol06G0085400 [Rhododendron molle]